MPKASLTDARVAALVGRDTPYERRDGKFKGFGVRAMPAGRKRFFVHCRHRGERVWKIVGDFDEIGVTEARSRTTAAPAAIGRGDDVPARPEAALFEAVAETVFRQYERVGKPRAFLVSRAYLRKRILPLSGVVYR